jgi:hypothetical protein
MVDNIGYRPDPYPVTGDTSSNRTANAAEKTANDGVKAARFAEGFGRELQRAMREKETVLSQRALMQSLANTGAAKLEKMQDPQAMQAA